MSFLLERKSALFDRMDWKVCENSRWKRDAYTDIQTIWKCASPIECCPKQNCFMD